MISRPISGDGYVDGDLGHWLWCPGCDSVHMVTSGPGSGARWAWNGSSDRPSFSPSISVRMLWGERQEERICHSYVTEGRWHFENDCWHHLRGKTVDIPPMSPEYMLP